VPSTSYACLEVVEKAHRRLLSVQGLTIARQRERAGRAQELQHRPRLGSSCHAPLPFSMMPRTMRRKCVSGSASPSHCAHAGMPRNGNMKPDSSIDGRKKKKVICIACSWFCASVEKVKPTARLASMNTPIIAISSVKLPAIGTSNSSRAAPRITPSWM
jgi:hypothetical protein